MNTLNKHEHTSLVQVCRWVDAMQKNSPTYKKHYWKKSVRETTLFICPLSIESQPGDIEKNETKNRKTNEQRWARRIIEMCFELCCLHALVRAPSVCSPSNVFMCVCVHVDWILIIDWHWQDRILESKALNKLERKVNCADTQKHKPGRYCGWRVI